MDRGNQGIGIRKRKVMVFQEQKAKEAEKLQNPYDCLDMMVQEHAREWEKHFFGDKKNEAVHIEVGENGKKGKEGKEVEDCEDGDDGEVSEDGEEVENGEVGKEVQEVEEVEDGDDGEVDEEDEEVEECEEDEEVQEVEEGENGKEVEDDKDGDDGEVGEKSGDGEDGEKSGDVENGENATDDADANCRSSDAAEDQEEEGEHLGQFQPDDQQAGPSTRSQYDKIIEEVINDSRNKALKDFLEETEKKSQIQSAFCCKVVELAPPNVEVS